MNLLDDFLFGSVVTYPEIGERFVRILLKKESTYENAVSDELKEVHRMVEIVKFDAETTISCVRLMEKLSRSPQEKGKKGNGAAKT